MSLLITESEFKSVKAITEKNEDNGTKHLFLSGCFLQGECKNRNGRIYPEEILDREANRYIKEYVQKNRAIGELNHPPTPQVDPERASHLTVEMTKDGVNWHGKAKILNTPMGNIVTGLIEGGVQIGVSSRGLGSLKEGKDGKVVQKDFFLSTIDIVSDPSAQEAWVNGIFEGKEWACPSEEEQYQIKKEIDDHIRNTKHINEGFLLQKFESYISSLR